MSDEQKMVPVELEGINAFSKLLDSKFRIPFTNIRFGVDFVVGLVPYAGDILSFLFSGGLVVTMARHGVSGKVLAIMLWNIFLDTTVGSIPLIGDVFDLFYKSNRRNYHLLEKHYGEGKYEGSIWSVLIPVLIALVLMLILMIWLVFKLGGLVWEFIESLLFVETPF